MTKKKYGPFICQVCKGEFYPLARSRYDASIIKCCSKKCRNILIGEYAKRERKEGFVYQCANCGKTIRDFPSRARAIKFCNKECYTKYQRRNSIIKTCKYCKKSFRTLYARKNRKYCSHKCYLDKLREGGEEHSAWNGGCAYYYGPNWQDQNEKARKRDNYTCQVCGKHQNDNYRDLDVHHIKRFQEFGFEKYEQANHLSNLITLCPTCHQKVESGKITL